MDAWRIDELARPLRAMVIASSSATSRPRSLTTTRQRGVSIASPRAPSPAEELRRSGDTPAAGRRATSPVSWPATARITAVVVMTVIALWSAAAPRSRLRDRDARRRGLGSSLTDVSVRVPNEISRVAGSEERGFTGHVVSEAPADALGGSLLASHVADVPAQDHHEGSSRGLPSALPSSLPLAAPPSALPQACIGNAGFRPERDAECYLAREAHALASAPDPTAADEQHMCWGFAGSRSLFHTIILGTPPPATRLLIQSFLATQCCDATLHVWLPASELRAQTGAASTGADAALPVIPPHHVGRVVYRELDVVALFAAVRDDFPDVNDTAAASMMDFPDQRYRANWARLLVLYTAGGVYVDADTLFLSDFRPLLDALGGAGAKGKPFSYRQGTEITMNIAVLRLPQRPSAATRSIIALAANRHHVTQGAITNYMAPWAEKSLFKDAVYAAITLFDPVWLEFTAGGLNNTHGNAEALKTIGGAEMLRALRRVDGFASPNVWDGFFKPNPYEDVQQRRAATPFFPGSLSYHWHKTGSRTITAGSWASIMLGRMEATAARKTVCSREAFTGAVPAGVVVR